MPIWRISTQRASPFEAALPIRARELFLARLLFTVAVVWLPLLAWFLAVLGHGETLWSPYAVLETSAIATLALMLPNAVRSGELNTPPFRIIALPFVALAVVSALAIYVLTPALALTLFVLAIVAVFLVTWLAIPESFQTAPVKAGAAAALVSATNESIAVRKGAAGWWWPILRSTIAPTSLLFFLLMVVWGAIGGPWLVYIFIVGTSVAMTTRLRTRWMYGLPLSHRAFLAIVLVPIILTVPGGLTIGVNVRIPFLTRMESITRRGPDTHPTVHYFSSRTNVPLEYWRRAPDGPLLAITASWGESYQPDTFRALGVTWYNPYSSGETSSQRFIEWQFERATTAVYGRPISLAAYDADGAVRPPQITRSPRMQILNGGGILAVVLCIVFFTEVGRSNRLTRTRPGRIIATMAGIVPMFGAIADMLNETRIGTPLFTPATESVLLHVSRILPSGLLPVIAVAAVPVIAMYALLEWQFGKSEMADRITVPSGR